MKTMKTLLAAASFLSLTATAHAAVLGTPPTTAAGFTDDDLYCNIVNFGNNTVNVIIEAKDFAGSLVIACSHLLAPGAGAGCLAPVGSAAAYCRFTVPGPARNFRAAAVYVDVMSEEYTAIVPAQ
jgi:hypothetical protein